jgi:hypothetical protein
VKQELLSILASALIAVESQGDVTAKGQAGEAGPMQIRPIVVEDVNRFAGTKFKQEDRLTYDGSFAMFCLYVDHYGINPTPEEAARIWNGGPSGPKKAATRGYWTKVRHELHTRGYDSNCVPYKSRKRYAPTRPRR